MNDLPRGEIRAYLRQINAGYATVPTVTMQWLAKLGYLIYHGGAFHLTNAGYKMIGVVAEDGKG